MKVFTKFLALAAALALSFGSFAGCKMASDGKDSTKNVESVKDGGDYSGYVKLTIEAGGQNITYNSTASLEYDEYTNRYPYNTLERLVSEWNKSHAGEYGYYFSVSSTAINNDRETMLPMLLNKTAPEIVYYLPTTIAEDQSKGYFYDLADIMNEPNKYSKSGEAGSVRWKDLYGEEEYSSFYSPDGQIFTVPMEKNPIGLLYNKTLMKAAGVNEEPATYKEFMEVQDKINAYAKTVNRADPSDDSKYICPFYSMYPWYDSYLESSLLSGVMKYLDVINEDGIIDAEEFVRGFMYKDGNGERYFSPDSDRYVELYRLIKQSAKYYPANYGSYYAEQQFIVGNVAMLEVVGGNIRSFIDQVGDDFEVGVMPYPVLETQPEGVAANDYYTQVKVEGNVRRGLSGYSTGWAISNSAMAKDAASGNDKCVKACIDMLMYLSCFENNDKMVNDRGFAIPLSGNTTYAHFVKLAEVYENDVKNPENLAWGAASSGSNMNKNYYDATVNFRKTALVTEMSAIKGELTRYLFESFVTEANTLYNQNKWGQKTWPAAGTERSR
ncbi:MAG: hypothetical protein IJU84_09530 [Clostridia bacterium]|nr:hypothetical protein [Clostridia bacterium]